MGIGLDDFRSMLHGNGADLGQQIVFDEAKGRLVSCENREQFATGLGFVVDRTPEERQQNVSARMLFLNALNRAFGVGGGDESVKAFMAKAERTLLGKSEGGYGKDLDDECYKPLTEREIRALIDEGENVVMRAVMKAFAESVEGGMWPPIDSLRQQRLALKPFLDGKKGTAGQQEEAARLLGDFTDGTQKFWDRVRKDGVPDLKAAVNAYKELHRRFLGGVGRFQALVFAEKLCDGANAETEVFKEKMLKLAPKGCEGFVPAVVRRLEKGSGLERLADRLAGMGVNENPDDVELEKLCHVVDLEKQVDDTLAAFKDAFPAKERILGNFFALGGARHLDRLTGAFAEIRDLCTEWKDRLRPDDSRLPALTAFLDRLAVFEATTQAEIFETGTVLTESLQQAVVSVKDFGKSFSALLKQAFAGEAGRFAETLSGVKLPYLRFVSEEEAEPASLSAPKASGKAGVKPNAGLAKKDSLVERELNTFCEEVDRLLALADGLKPRQKDDFIHLVDSVVGEVGGAVTEALKEGVDLGGGIVGLLKPKLASLQTALDGALTTSMLEALEPAFDQVIQLLNRKIAEAGSGNPNTQDALRRELDAVTVFVRKTVPARLEELKGQGIVLNPEDVRALSEDLKKTVDAFVARAFEAKGKLFGANDKLRKMQAVVPEFRNTGVGADPFQGVADGRFADVAELQSATKSAHRFNRLFGDAVKALVRDDGLLGGMIQAALIKFDDPRIAQVFDTDPETHSIRGYTTKGGEIANGLRASLSAFVEERLRAGAVPADAPMSEQQILDALKDRIADELAAEIRIAVSSLEEDEAAEEASQEAPPQPKHPYPAGSGLFGLDVGSLNEEQLAGLRCLVKGVLYSEARNGIDRFEKWVQELKKHGLFPGEGADPVETETKVINTVKELKQRAMELWNRFFDDNNKTAGVLKPRDEWKTMSSPEFTKILKDNGIPEFLISVTDTDFGGTNAVRSFEVYMSGALFTPDEADHAVAMLNSGLKLEGLSEPYVSLLSKMLRGSKTDVQTELTLGGGLGLRGAQETMAFLKEVGLTPASMAGFPAISGAMVSDFKDAMVFLYGLNYKSLQGLQAVCLRYFGVTVRELFEAIVTQGNGEWRLTDDGLPPAREAWARFSRENTLGNAKAAERDMQDTARRNVEARKSDETEYNVKDWREDYDPLLMAAEDEKRAARFLMRQLQPSLGPKGTVDKDTCQGEIAFRAELERLQAGVETEIKVFGVPVKLLADADGRISAKVKMRPPGGAAKARDAKTTKPRWVSVFVPVDRMSFIGQIDDAVVQNVGAYGVKAAQKILRDAIGVEPDSSRVRQLSMNVICSYAGLRTADLCYDSTARLRQLALDLLGGKASPDTAAGRKAYAKAELGRKIDGAEKLVLLNSVGTLEIYQRMRKKTEDKDFRLSDKVEVPDPVRIRKGETLAQARIRQVHEFAADLVQIADSTKYDLDRQSGKSEEEILRETLVSHRTELKMLLQDPGLLDTFDIPGGANGLALTTFREKLEAGIRTLRGFWTKDMDFDAFVGYLAKSQQPQLTNFLTGFRKGLTETSTAVLKVMQKSFKDKLVAAFQKGMASVDQPLWKKSLDELAGGGGLDVKTGYGKFLMQVIGSYFAEMDPVDMNRMAAQVIRLSTSKSTSGETLGALLKSAGPILQKFMQGLPQTSLPDDLREAVTDLKSRLPSIPENAVRAYLLDMVESSGGRIEKIIVDKSLGAATVGQAFLCTMVTKEHPEGEECVIKILRPDVQSRALREEAFFLKQAEKLGLGEMLKDRFDRIFEELDLVIEAGNVLGGGVYDPGTVTYAQSGVYSTPDVRSMKLNPLVNPTMNTMVLVKAPGMTLDSYIERVAEDKKAILRQLKPESGPDGRVRYKASNLVDYMGARYQLNNLYRQTLRRQKFLTEFITKWSFEAVFGSGFFHGDVHAGNLMVSDECLTVIDYGNATRLTDDERTNIMWMMARVGVNSASGFLDHLKDAMRTDAQKKALDKISKTAEADLTQIFDKGDVDDSGRKFVAAVQYLQGKGIPIPGALFNLMQSMSRLDESVRLLNEQLEDIRQTIDSMGVDLGAEEQMSWILKDELIAAFKTDGPDAVLQSKDSLVKATKPFYSMDASGKQVKYSRFKTELTKTLNDGDIEGFKKRLDDLDAFFEAAKDWLADDMVLSSQVAPILRVIRAMRAELDGDASPEELVKGLLFRQLVSDCETGIMAVFGMTASDAAYEKPELPMSFADALSTAITDGVETISVGLTSVGEGFVIKSAAKTALKLKKSRKGQTGKAEALLDGFVSDHNAKKLGVQVFPRELELAKGMGFQVLVPKDFGKTPGSVKWKVRDDPARKLMLDVLATNLKAFKDRMAKAGLGDRLAKPEVVKTYAEMQAIRLSVLVPELASCFARLTPAELAEAKKDAQLEESGLDALFGKLYDLAINPPKEK